MREFIEGDITTLSNHANSPVTFNLYMHKANKLYNYETRDITINYAIGRNNVFNINGNIYHTYKVQEREMGLVSDILNTYERDYTHELPSYKDTKGVTYALSTNEYVYSWGKGGYAGHGITTGDTYILKPKRITSINEPIKAMHKIDNKVIYYAKTGDNKYILSNSLPYCITNIKDNISRIENGFVLTENNVLYYVGLDGNNEKIMGKEVTEINNIKSFNPTASNEVYITTVDNTLYRVVEGKKEGDNTVGYVVDKVASDVFDYKVRKSTDSSSHVFVLNNNKELFHKAYLYSSTSSGNGECVSGIGNGLPKTDYTSLKKINIPEKIETIYSFPSSRTINNYPVAAIEKSGTVYRWGCIDGVSGVDKNKLSLPQALSLPGEKIIKYNVSEHDEWDNFVYILTESHNIYDATTIHKDKPVKLNIPNSDKIQNVHRMNIKFFLADSGKYYKLTWNKNQSKINLVNNFENYQSAIVPFYYGGGSYIFMDKNKKLYALGLNEASSNVYYLGFGDLERTGEYEAVQLSEIKEPVKNMYTISRNNTFQNSTIVFTEANTIYVWGVNSGLLPIGNTDPVKKLY